MSSSPTSTSTTNTSNSDPAVTFQQASDEEAPVANPSESSPLTSISNHNQWSLTKHLSMAYGSDGIANSRKRNKLLLSGLAIGLAALLFPTILFVSRGNRNVRSVEHAQEHFLELEDGIQIWFRTWGKRDGIPLVFVHGGPGNAIADYFGNSNKRFFDANTFFVVEVDQRGTGNSQPSVRDGKENMQYYTDISIDQICDDFESIRRHLGIEKWLVWGGSFGSTLAINYGERYPESCTALILRGVYLDTAEEVYAVYSRQTYLKNAKRLHEFDILYDYASKAIEESKEDPLDPDDAERLLRIYAKLIADGDEYAIWHWFVFENNLMELDPKNILDPDQIDFNFYRESLSVSFFETHLWLHGSFDQPTSDLMNPAKIDNLTFPIWVCQGQLDEVCPPQYARTFVNAVAATGRSPSIVARFLNATHEDTDPEQERCLKMSLLEFVETNQQH